METFRDARAPRSGQERCSAYDDFRTHYLNLEPELANSPAVIEALIEMNGFDWLNQLLEETLDEEPLAPVVPLPQRPAFHSDRQAA